MQVKDAIQTRLSVRRYAGTAIPDDDMQVLFKALQFAPSANNLQNWEFVFVGDPELKRDLIPACSGQRFVGDCAYLIAAVADPTRKWHMVDITIALTNLTLQAVELGFGTCWVGAFDETQVKRILNIPDEKKVVICMALGKPEGRHIPKGRKATDSFVYLDQFGKSWTK